MAWQTANSLLHRARIVAQVNRLISCSGYICPLFSPPTRFSGVVRSVWTFAFHLTLSQGWRLSVLDFLCPSGLYYSHFRLQAVLSTLWFRFLMHVAFTTFTRSHDLIAPLAFRLPPSRTLFPVGHYLTHADLIMILQTQVYLHVRHSVADISLASMHLFVQVVTTTCCKTLWVHTYTVHQLRSNSYTLRYT